MNWATCMVVMPPYCDILEVLFGPPPHVNYAIVKQDCEPVLIKEYHIQTY